MADNEEVGNGSYSSNSSGGVFHHKAFYLQYEQYRPGQNVPRPTKPQTDYPTLPGTSQGPSWADIAYHHLTHNPGAVVGLFTTPITLLPFTNSQVQDALVDAAIWAYNNPSEAGHLFLDAVGLVPGLGEAADAINSIWYSIEGDTTNAALSLAAVIPFAGWAATGGKVMSKLPLPSMAEATVKILNKVDDALETAQSGIVLRNLGNDVVGELFDGQRLEKILANHLKIYGSVVTGDESVRMLRYLDAQAAYLPRAGGPGTLVIGPNATRLQVIEELIHHGQYKRIGFPEMDSVQSAFVGARFEIEAQDTLLGIARRKGWSQAEIDLIIRNRVAWVDKLQELTERYGHGY